jgi:hypothetical protein
MTAAKSFPCREGGRKGKGSKTLKGVNDEKIKHKLD